MAAMRFYLARAVILVGSALPLLGYLVRDIWPSRRVFAGRVVVACLLVTGYLLDRDMLHGDADPAPTCRRGLRLGPAKPQCPRCDSAVA